MKQRIVKIIMLLTAVSISGLIATQMFWIRSAVNLSEKQFNHRVTMALDGAMSDFVVLSNRSAWGAENIRASNGLLRPVVPAIDSLMLDSLISNHFSNFDIHTEFDYAIVPDGTTNNMVCSRKILSRSISVNNVNYAHKAVASTPDGFHVEVYFNNDMKSILSGMIVWLSISFVFILILIISFIFALRILIMNRKYTQMKNDFISNITHEFKTPISTISMASEVLLNSQPSSSYERIQRYSQIINNENKRLREQVDRVLQVAVLETEGVELNRQLIDIHSIIEKSILNLSLEKRKKPYELIRQFNASEPLISADEYHLTKALEKLIDNAYNYSPEHIKIKIITENRSDGVLISIEDRGQGLTSDSRKRIFDKFYRASTGNIHDVKGFGLSLFYVKSVVEAHGGYVKVKSELNKGSRFSLFFPKY